MPADRFPLTVAPEVRALGVEAGFLLVEDADNRHWHAAQRRLRDALHDRLRDELHPDFIAQDAVLAGFRELHRTVGRSGRRYTSSAEALVALYQRRGLIPEIAPLVHLYNCVSLETRLSLGAHDCERLAGPVRLRLAAGDEHFLPLGATVPEPVGEGEYCYFDADDEVLCRLEVRQCDRTRLTADTRRCLFIVQGNAAAGAGPIEAALARLAALVRECCGARVVGQGLAGQ